MVALQAEIWWADLSDPVGSFPDYRRPVVILQSDALNRSRLATVICVVLSSNLRWANGSDICRYRPSHGTLTAELTRDRKLIDLLGSQLRNGKRRCTSR
ncbi:MAG: type II toxin-antitoxin system PemK/MazF family toxin [Pirellula sp.]